MNSILKINYIDMYLIHSPEVGTIVYNTTTLSFMIYTGSKWAEVSTDFDRSVYDIELEKALNDVELIGLL